MMYACWWFVQQHEIASSALSQMFKIKRYLLAAHSVKKEAAYALVIYTYIYKNIYAFLLYPMQFKA